MALRVMDTNPNADEDKTSLTNLQQQRTNLMHTIAVGRTDVGVTPPLGYHWWMSESCGAMHKLDRNVRKSVGQPCMHSQWPPCLTPSEVTDEDVSPNLNKNRPRILGTWLWFLTESEDVNPRWLSKPSVEVRNTNTSFGICEACCT